MCKIAADVKTGQAEREKIVENIQVGECFGGKFDVSDYHRKASWSIDLTSPCSNRCDAIRSDSTDSL